EVVAVRSIPKLIDGGDDQARQTGGEIEIGHAAARRAIAYEQHVGLAGESSEQIPPGRGHRVEGDALLAGVQVEERQATLAVEAVVGERAEPPTRIALGRLDLDHLGAE